MAESKQAESIDCDQERVIGVLTSECEEVLRQMTVAKEEQRTRLDNLRRESEASSRQKETQFNLIIAGYLEKKEALEARITKIQSFKAGRLENLAAVEAIRDKLRVESNLIKDKRLQVVGDDLGAKNQNLQIEKENITLQERANDLARKMEAETKANEKTNAKSKLKFFQLLASLEKTEEEYRRRKLEQKMREEREAILENLKNQEQEDLEANGRAIREFRGNMAAKLAEMEGKKNRMKEEIATKDQNFRAVSAPLVEENQRLRKRLELGEAVARGLNEQRKLANFMFQKYERLIAERVGLSTRERVWRLRDLRRSKAEPFQRTDDQQQTYLFNLIKSKVYHHKVA